MTRVVRECEDWLKINNVIKFANFDNKKGKKIVSIRSLGWEFCVQYPCKSPLSLPSLQAKGTWSLLKEEPPSKVVIKEERNITCAMYNLHIEEPFVDGKNYKRCEFFLVITRD